MQQVRRSGEVLWRDNTALPLPGLAAGDYCGTFHYSPVRGDSGAIEGVLFMCTRHYLARDVRSDGRFGYAAVIHSMDLGFAIIEAQDTPPDELLDYRFIEVNEAWSRQTGLGEVTGKRVNELPTPREPALAQMIREVLDTGHSQRRVTEHRPWQRTIDLFAMRLGGPGSRQAALLVRDVSVEARALQALKEAHERKDEFLAMLAHELRNPLAPIGAAAELMGRPGAGQELMLHTSGIIARQVRHMTGLVDDLLDMSRVNRGAITLCRERLDTHAVLHDALEQVMPLLRSRGHRLEQRLPAQPVAFEGDRKRIIQVLANLLSNAIKYTPEGGRIEVRLGQDGDRLEIRVSDNGLGMDRETLARAFELFTQAERTSDRQQGGLGIGLALVKKLVELHGGQVQAFSPGPGQGSEFVVQLPLGRPDDAGLSAPPVAVVPPRSMRVMVVDDHVDAALTLGMLIESEGHRCQTVHEPRQALQLALRQAPDAFVLDIGLPGMDGRELARQLRAQRPTRQALLIALSGYAQPADRQAALDAGFDEYLVKPVDSHRLLALLADHAQRVCGSASPAAAWQEAATADPA